MALSGSLPLNRLVLMRSYPAGDVHARPCAELALDLFDHVLRVNREFLRAVCSPTTVPSSRNAIFFLYRVSNCYMWCVSSSVGVRILQSMHASASIHRSVHLSKDAIPACCLDGAGAHFCAA